MIITTQQNLNELLTKGISKNPTRNQSPDTLFHGPLKLHGPQSPFLERTLVSMVWTDVPQPFNQGSILTKTKSTKDPQWRLKRLNEMSRTQHPKII